MWVVSALNRLVWSCVISTVWLACFKRALCPNKHPTRHIVAQLAQLEMTRQNPLAQLMAQLMAQLWMTLRKAVLTYV